MPGYSISHGYACFRRTPMNIGGAVSSWQIVDQYGEIAFNPQTVATAVERNFIRTPVVLPVNVSALKVLRSAFYVNGTTLAETALTNDLQAGHGWVKGSTVLGFDSSRTTIPAGAGATEMSLLTASGLVAGDVVWLNSEVDVPSGGGQNISTIPYVTGTQYGGYGRTTSNLSTTQLNVASPTGLGTTNYRAHHRAVVGYGVHGYSWAVLGDSIAYNNQDANLGDGGEIGQNGRTLEGGAWVRRGFMKASRLAGKTIPFAMSARASATMDLVSMARRAIYPYASVLLIQIGTNDLNGGMTVATLKARVETEISIYKAAFSAANPGITPRVVVCTLLPRGNPTPLATIPTYNALVRAGSIIGSDGYWDPNRMVSNFGTGDESTWADAANDTSDFTHPLTPGHVKIVAEPVAMLAQTIPWRAFG